MSRGKICFSSSISGESSLASADSAEHGLRCRTRASGGWGHLPRLALGGTMPLLASSIDVEDGTVTGLHHSTVFSFAWLLGASILLSEGWLPSSEGLSRELGLQWTKGFSVHWPASIVHDVVAIIGRPRDDVDFRKVRIHTFRVPQNILAEHPQ